MTLHSIFNYNLFGLHGKCSSLDLSAKLETFGKKSFSDFHQDCNCGRLMLVSHNLYFGAYMYVV